MKTERSVNISLKHSKHLHDFVIVNNFGKRYCACYKPLENVYQKKNQKLVLWRVFYWHMIVDFINERLVLNTSSLTRLLPGLMPGFLRSRPDEAPPKLSLLSVGWNVKYSG